MNHVSQLDRLVDKFTSRLESIALFSNLLQGNVDLERYGGFLIQTYHYVRYTADSIHMAADGLSSHPNLIYKEIAQKLKSHESEEIGHEQWVLNDIKNIGMDPKIVEDVPPCNPIIAYNAYSRYVVTSSSPIAILGEAYMLEGLAQRHGSTIAARLVEKSNIPNINKAISFIKGHGYTDIKHMEESREILYKITDSCDIESIVLCANVVAQLYASMIEVLDSD